MKPLKFPEEEKSLFLEKKENNDFFFWKTLEGLQDFGFEDLAVIEYLNPPGQWWVAILAAKHISLFRFNLGN
jgi:hypothetical protein